MPSTRFPKTFPSIETPRLLLRAIRPDDGAAIFKNFSDPDVAKWFFEQPLTELSQAMQFIDAFALDFQQGEGLTWAIALKPGDSCIGTCGYGDLEVGARGDIGFDLAKDQWGKGLMAEALRAIISYGFEELDVAEVEAHTCSNNARAIRLLEKLGFEMDKVSEDSHYFSVSKAAWG